MQERACFTQEHGSVDTFVVVETGDIGYRISDHTDEWKKPYWMSEDEFDSITEDAEFVGLLNSGQYATLCEEIGLVKKA